MSVVATVLVALVALIHVYIVVLEMVLWTTPRGRAAFGLEEQFAIDTRALAANQGLYNGFLAAGLAYGLLRDDVEIQALFLVFVLVAGLFGAATASRRILVVQALPAALALGALALA
ncbi:DUF1304 domain-containing protein [Aeromicrobium massiliense]|uniref:DUF1304 domain-containing protein n=1 Tax=Aeromicrobium massiliense TaxID=1464554 RepID=UPI0002D7A879|nr:DUF1304 domain-containing protein [Aeromicrobium massiliense]